MQSSSLKHVVLAGIVVAGLSLAASSKAGYIDVVTNLEWRQLTETTSISYNALNTGGVNGCSAATGECSGNIGAADLNGWTWASEPEVRQLFHNFSGAQFIPGFTPLPSSPFSYFEFIGAWVAAIIDVDGSGPDAGIFDATFVSPFRGENIISGITRTESPSGRVFAPRIVNPFLQSFARTDSEVRHVPC